MCAFNVGNRFSPELLNVTLNFYNSYFQTQTSVVYSPEKDFADFVWAGAVNLLILAGWGALFFFIAAGIVLPELRTKEKRQGLSVHKDHVVSELRPPFATFTIKSINIS